MAPADLISRLMQETERLSLAQVFSLLANRFRNAVTFSSSFSYEDQVITHLIASAKVDINIFTLDTGRLFPETYSVWENTNARYGIKISAYYPDYQILESFLQKKGPNAFYTSVENRQECCHIRKVEPLKRALKGNVIWITGLRAEHSPDRKDLQRLEWDEGNSIIKYNPLLEWTTEEVVRFIKDNHVSYNILHDRGFASIGCAPCTRAIQEGEDFRAGRWWWEGNNKKECGLHSRSIDHS